MSEDAPPNSKILAGIAPALRTRYLGLQGMTHSKPSQASVSRYRVWYNRLPDIDIAYESFQRRVDHVAVVRAALRIIDQHGAAGYLGLLLLHRHFDAKPGTIFVERRFTPRRSRQQQLLITAPYPLRVAPRRLGAHRFQVEQSGDLCPLEYTTDPAAIAASRKLNAAPELRRSLAKHLFKHGYEQLLGLGVYRRSGLSDRTPRVLVEETDFVRRQSVMRAAAHGTHHGERFIPTLWTFGNTDNGCCTYKCVLVCTNHSGNGGNCAHGKVDHLGCV